MASVINEISAWASALPFWEQAALDKVIAGTPINNEDYDLLLGFLLEDAQLTPKSTAPRPQLALEKLALQQEAQPANLVRLTKISKLQGINALAPNQALTFGDKLTVIYGANGSGKSGYARVIGSAAFTRGDKQVLRDVNKPENKCEPMMAEIEIADQSGLHTLEYRIGQACPEMRGFYVFDSTSVKAHLTKSNPLSFSPAGLAHLTRMAEVTDEVRKRLAVEVEKRRRTNPFAALFAGESDVSALIKQLGAQTNLSLLHALGTFSPAEAAEIDLLDKRIATLKSEDAHGEQLALQSAIADLLQLKTNIATSTTALNNESVAAFKADLEVWRRCDAATRAMSVEQFREDGFGSAGTDPWLRFVNAAKVLAAAEAQEGQNYPQAGDRCLLCQQPLSQDAQALLSRLWFFLSSEAETQLKEACRKVDVHLARFNKLDLSYFNTGSAAYRELKSQSPSTFQRVASHMEACDQRRVLLLDAGRHDAFPELPALSEDATHCIDDVIQSIQTKIQLLAAHDPQAEIEALECKKVQLEHRRLLGKHMAEIEQYVLDQQWAAKADKGTIKRSTKHISQKHNELFNQLVTQQYLDLFEKLLNELHCPRQVKVATKTSKGETYKQIALQADPSASSLAQPDKVLSEGEQRAVALADFLTEVALDANACGVVFDDPVTSLDFDWKEAISEHIVREAQLRQVIVFTHDLHFVHCIKECAESQSIPLAAHWIQRRNDKPGYVFLDNSPASEREYRKTDKVKKILEQAKNEQIPPEEQQRLLKEGFGALRTCYEVFVMTDLFGEVVLRFSERVSIDRLKNVAIDFTIRDEVIAKVGCLSRYIEGHSHSDSYASGQLPTPDLLKKELDAFEVLRKRHKDFKKAQGIAT